ncbi:MAG: hypothetical protein ACNA8R_08890 [Nitriliruptoraceae bacterium]
MAAEVEGAAARGDAPILTVPDVLEEVTPVQPTGSPWVALPDLDVVDGTVPSLTVLHERAGGLLEVTGDPLAALTARVDGQPVPREAWTLEVHSGLLPRWSATMAGCQVRLTIACPPEQRGVVIEVVARRHGSDQDHQGAPHRAGTPARPLAVELEVGGRVSGAALHVFSGRPLAGPHRWRSDPWSRALVWELGAGLPVLGLAVRAADGAAPELHHDGRPEGAVQGDGEVTTGGVGLGPRWAHRRRLDLAPGEAGELVVLLGVGREADSASLATVDLARRGAAASIAATRTWYAARCGPDLGPDRAALQQVRDRNRLFCLTFAAGRTIDSDELVLVTSRSPRYYVSGAHWTRDSLLWAYPAVLAVDREEAARWLRVALTRYSRHPGDHALSITGGSLYPGFELDQVCAFHLAIDALLAVDPGAVTVLLADPTVAAGLARVDAALDGAWDETTGLYATFLLSSDDPAPLPFVTWSNGLAVAALRARSRRRRHLAAHRPAGPATGTPDREDALQDEAAATALLAAIDRHLVIDGPSGPMFAGAGDGRGTHVRFDEPPGSLELLAHHGVVGEDDPRWRATVAWIHSDHNPHGPGPGRFATPTCAHAGHPWLLAVGNALLRGEHRWLDLLPEMPLDQGLACETVDADTGRPRTGLAFATCAGWLAHAIDVATAAAVRDPEDPS